MRIESTGIDLLAKTLHPLLGRTADINFVESTKFLGRLSAAAENNGPGVQELANKLEGVRPEVRAKFSEIAAKVHSRAVSRVAEQTLKITPAVSEAPAEALAPAGADEEDAPLPIDEAQATSR